MCFSAPVSFAASGALALLGGASFRIAKKKDKILALIPIVFAIQQALEGFQWIYLNKSLPSIFLAYSFLFFALIFWPVYIPSSILILERHRQTVLKWFLFLGISTALFYLFVLFTVPMSVTISGYCISYNFYNPLFIKIAYLLAILMPLFTSSNKLFKGFSLAIIISVFISYIFFYEVSLSVWCFFAAIISSMFYFHLKSKNSL
jgi:hypothetical protein